jgi:hypothetical protein
LGLEQCEDAVACVVRAPPAVSGQQAVDDVFVDIQLMTPMCVAVGGQQFSRSDDVGE